MVMVMIFDEVVTADTGNSNELSHYFCKECYPGETIFAYCGTDVSDEEEMSIDSEEDIDCVVCVDLEHCPNDPEH